MSTEQVTHLRRLSQQYAYSALQMHETIGRKAGLSGTDHKYLGFLIQKGAMTAGELANLTGLTTGAVTGLIDRFEKKNLVKRQFAEGDRRKVIIVPDIDKIMALLAPLYADFRSASEQLLASFSAQEMQVIENYFVRAIELMNQETEKLNMQA